MRPLIKIQKKVLPAVLKKLPSPDIDYTVGKRRRHHIEPIPGTVDVASKSCREAERLSTRQYVNEQTRSIHQTGQIIVPIIYLLILSWINENACTLEIGTRVSVSTSCCQKKQNKNIRIRSVSTLTNTFLCFLPLLV